MNRTRGMIVGLALLATAGSAFGGKDEPAPAPYDSAELEAKLDEAREQLDQAARKLAELHKAGYAGEGGKRPMLGILLDDGNETDGIHLVGVTPGGGAQAAGLAAGDRLVEVDGTRLDGGDRPALYVLKEVLAKLEPGDAVDVEYVRGTTAHRAEIVTQAPAEHVAHMLDGKFDDWHDAHGDQVKVIMGSAPGLVDVDENLGAYFGVTEGVLVVKAPVGGELSSGDILLALDGAAVTSAGTATVAIASANGPVEAKVRRNGREVTVAIEPGQFGVAGSGIAVPDVRVIRVDKIHEKAPESPKPKD